MVVLCQASDDECPIVPDSGEFGYLKKVLEKMNKNTLLRITKLLSIIFLLFLIAFFSDKIAPYNMDEFCHYHSIISRHYKYNVLNTFRENCRGYDLNFLNTGLSLPLRAYAYEGSFSSLCYYPLFLIWRSPKSARFWGLLFLLVQSLLLGRIFNFKYEYILLFLLAFFPYFFQHLVDTGPIFFTTTSIFLLYWLMKKWLDGLQLKYPLIMALIVFLGIWAKLTYFWLLPGIGILFLISVLERKELPEGWKKKIPLQILGSTLLLLVLLSFIFLSTDPQDSSRFPYIEQITSSQSLSLKQLFQLNFIKERGVVKALFNPFEATQRIFVVKKPNLMTKFYSGFIFLFVPACLLLLRIDWFKRIKSSLFYLAFMVAFVITLLTQRAWAMHHTVLCFPFLILSIFATIDLLRKYHPKKFPIIVSALFIIFVILNSYFFITFPKQEIRLHDDWSKMKIHEILQDRQLAKEYFYVVVDWGMYYYQGLYGPDFQSVLYIEPLNNQNQIDALKKLSEKHKRKLLFVYRNDTSSSNLGLIRKSFHLRAYGETSKNQIWRIMLEE